MKSFKCLTPPAYALSLAAVWDCASIGLGTANEAVQFSGDKIMKLQLKSLVPVLALIVIVVSIPFALVDTLETGRLYLFSSQFLQELPQRFSGTGRFRFILQPLIAILLGVRGGIADAKAGNPPYLFNLVFAAGRRREILRSAWTAISTLFAMGIILDVVFQLVLYGEVHPGAALLVGPILIFTPYVISRALTTRLVRGLRS